MSRESLILEFYDASAPLRQAATEEVIIRCFGGIGPDEPRISRITVEYEDPRNRSDGPAVHDGTRTEMDVVRDLARTIADQPGSCSGVVAEPDELARSLSAGPQDDSWGV